MYGYIYLIHDSFTNKVYIGQKKGTPENTQNYFGSGKTIKQIIKKRKHHLSKRILGCCKTKEELDDAEKICIEFYYSNVVQYGYNISDGPVCSFSGHIHSKKSKQKISLAISGDKNGFYGKKHSQKTITQIKQKLVIPFEIIKQQIENTGYKLLTTKNEYHGVNTRIKTLCLNGHEYNVLTYAFLKGNRCKCELPLKTRIPFEKIQNECNKRNYKLLTTKKEYYKPKKQSKMKVICSNKHEVELNIINFLSGHGCPICGRMKKNENDRRMHKFDDKLKKQIIKLFRNEYKVNEIIEQLQIDWSYNTLKRRLKDWGEI